MAEASVVRRTAAAAERLHELVSQLEPGQLQHDPIESQALSTLRELEETTRRIILRHECRAAATRFGLAIEATLLRPADADTKDDNSCDGGDSGGGGDGEGGGGEGGGAESGALKEAWTADGGDAPPETPRKMDAAKTVRVPRPETKPFSNHKKFEEKRRNGANSPRFVTTSGAYLSDADRRKREEALARAKSIHDKTFCPVAVVNYSRTDRENAEFAAAGFILPNDLPKSAAKFNDFYNSTMHKFRPSSAKQSIYM